MRKLLKTLPDWCLLGIWIIVGAIVRFLFLTDKPPWTDEFATMVFSAGNRFDTIPIDRLVSIETLFSLLQPHPTATANDVTNLLLSEDNHPPLYFAIAHFWMKLFPDRGIDSDLWITRALPALFGVFAIPALYFLGRIAFSSRLVGHLCAAMMAVSPYAIFSAQEARHYTLAILFVIASLLCYLLAIRSLVNHQNIAYKLIFIWLIITIFGLLTHYFFLISIGAEIIPLLFLAYAQIYRREFRLSNWFRVGIVFLGTASFLGVWFLGVIPQDHGSQMTDWIVRDTKNFRIILDPVFQLFGTLLTMVSLLPVESDNLAIVILSGALMLAFFLYAIPRCKKVWVSVDSVEFRGVVGFFISAIALFFLISYLLGMDITKGARYSFVYFPAVLIIIAVLLAECWRRGDRRFVAIVLLMGLISSIGVTANLGYRKYYWPDRLVPILQENSSKSPLIITHYKSLVQVGEMLGIAREYQKQFPDRSPRFLFLSQIEEIKNRPEFEGVADLWLVNFPNPVDLYFNPDLAKLVELPHCQQVSAQFPYVAGYIYQKYSCER
jgi:uncharacterized membrane protein